VEAAHYCHGARPGRRDLLCCEPSPSPLRLLQSSPMLRAQPVQHRLFLFVKRGLRSGHLRDSRVDLANPFSQRNGSGRICVGRRRPGGL